MGHSFEKELEFLEFLHSKPIAERLPNHHIDIYDRVVLLEQSASEPSQFARLYLLWSQVLADMEPDIFTKAVRKRFGLPDSDTRTFSGHDAIDAALQAADLALMAAQSARDDAREARAERQRGHLLRRLLDYPEAIESYRASNDLLLRAKQKHGAVDPSLAHDLLDSRIRLVGLAYILGDTPAARSWLDGATLIAQEINAKGGAKANVDEETIWWMRALLARAEGDALTALTSATRAADAYMRKEPSVSRVRILTLATDAALDEAENAPAEASRREDFLKQAERYLMLTQQAAAEVKDKAGAEMAVLCEARLLDLQRPGTKLAVSKPRGVLRRMEELREWDWALELDAQTTLGRMLLKRRQRGEARDAFQQAVKIAHEHESPGSAWYAKQALDQM